MTVIFKRKGHKSDPGNYRPVSLTSQIGKIFERPIRDRIVSFLEYNCGDFGPPFPCRRAVPP